MSWYPKYWISTRVLDIRLHNCKETIRERAWAMKHFAEQRLCIEGKYGVGTPYIKMMLPFFQYARMYVKTSANVISDRANSDAYGRTGLGILADRLRFRTEEQSAKRVRGIIEQYYTRNTLRRTDIMLLHASRASSRGASDISVLLELDELLWKLEGWVIHLITRFWPWKHATNNSGAPHVPMHSNPSIPGHMYTIPFRRRLRQLLLCPSFAALSSSIFATRFLNSSYWHFS